CRSDFGGRPPAGPRRRFGIHTWTRSHSSLGMSVNFSLIPSVDHDRSTGATFRTGFEPALLVRPAQRVRLPRHRKGEQFLRGPIPLRWLLRAAELRGAAFRVAIAAWHRTQLRGVGVRLPRELLQQFGVGHDSATRAYAQLERAGLISVERTEGKAPT